jgi:CRISPR-associated protein Csb1
MAPTSESKTVPLDLKALQDSLAGVEGASPVAAIRCRTRLQPDGGDGGKVFPPTYAGGIYAVEDRRIDGKVVRCVLLDSVQSQANRFEDLLMDAFLPEWREAGVDGLPSTCDLPVIAVQVENHGWITSLTAPHRVHDAILRDSEVLDSKGVGTRFRETDIGKAIVAARVHNATAFYRHCPTALLFGTWDSTAGEGLNSAKVPRAVVSEIIGVDITPGVRTGSRLDPLGIRSGTVYYKKKEQGTWSLDQTDGLTKGKPSDINHGNVTPDIARFGDRREVQKQHLDVLPDILGDTSDNRATIGEHSRKPGGITMAYALHTWTLSFTQLRRLRFPGLGAGVDISNDARTALAALALYGLALQHERGCWLRSRCELIPEGPVTLELVGGASGQNGDSFTLPSAKDIREKLLQPTLAKATWEKKVFRLTPSKQLAELVKRSDAAGASEETESTESGTDSDGGNS